MLTKVKPKETPFTPSTQFGASTPFTASSKPTPSPSFSSCMPFAPSTSQKLAVQESHPGQKTPAIPGLEVHPHHDYPAVGIAQLAPLTSSNLGSISPSDGVPIPKSLSECSQDHIKRPRVKVPDVSLNEEDLKARIKKLEENNRELQHSISIAIRLSDKKVKDLGGCS